LIIRFEAIVEFQRVVRRFIEELMALRLELMGLQLGLQLEAIRQQARLYLGLDYSDFLLLILDFIQLLEQAIQQELH